MRSIQSIMFGFVLCCLALASAHAETFQLASGRTIEGDVLAASANEEGVQVRMSDGQYERIAWSEFSQEALRKLAEDRRMAPFARIFIEVSEDEKQQQDAVEIREPTRLARPAGQSLLGALFSSGLGVVVLLIVYAANLLAAYEISIFRNQPVGLVCGVAAIVPLLGPIVFLSMPTRLRDDAEEQEESSSLAPPTIAAPTPSAPQVTGVATPRAPGSAPPPPVNPLAPDTPPAPARTGGLRLPSSEMNQPRVPAAPKADPEPQVQVFQRGAFTFNRRFFETKFAGFLGAAPREAEAGRVLAVKTTRGTFVADCIARIGATDMHLQVQTESGTEEVMVPFSEIQEIQLKPKGA